MSARNEREALAELLEEEQESGRWASSPTADLYGFMADAILAAGYRKPRIVATVEELDALPTDSTVRSAQGGVWFKETSGKGCSWTEPGAQWWHWATDIALPATVIYEP